VVKAEFSWCVVFFVKTINDKWLEQTDITFLMKLDKSATDIYKILPNAHGEHGLLCGSKTSDR
jgi:hypothetical protein